MTRFRLGPALVAASAIAACAAPPAAVSPEDGGTASVSAPGKGGVGGDGNPRKPAPSPKPTASRGPIGGVPVNPPASGAPASSGGPLTTNGSDAPSAAPGTPPSPTPAASPDGAASPAPSPDGGFASAAPSAAPSFEPPPSVAPSVAPSIVPTLTGGAVTILAGTIYGEDDGAAGVARFAQPSDLALDAQGRLYVADQGSAKVRRVAADGAVITLATAAGQAHVIDGLQFLAVSPTGEVTVPVGTPGDNHFERFAHQAAKTRLGTYSAFASDQVRSVAHGPDGRVYYALPLVGECPIFSIGADGGNQELKDGSGLSVGLPSTGDGKGMAIAPDGTIYVIKAARVFRARPGEAMAAFAGGVDGYADGQGATARFRDPQDLAVMPDGSLLVADTFNHRIRHVTTAGLVTTIAGTGELGFTEGAALQCRFQTPRGIAVGADNTVYVADTFNHKIRKFKVQ